LLGKLRLDKRFFYLGTGSEKCVLPARIIDAVSLKPADCRLFAANGTTINVIGEKTLDVHVGDVTIPTRFVVSSNVTEPMLGVNWLRANKIIWDFAKDLLIVNGEVFDMILEEKSQELKRRRWLQARSDEIKNEGVNEIAKRIKLDEKSELEVINRIWALPVVRVIDVKNDDCIYRAPLTGGMNLNDIRYPCYLCGPSTKGFSRARDLMRHSVCSHDLFPARVEQGKHYKCNGLDLVAPTPEQYDRYSNGSHRGKKKLEESE